MGDNLLATTFPAGQAMLFKALRREGIRAEQVSAQILHHSWSWALEVKLRDGSVRLVRQLPPDDLRADTAFSEMCESIAQDLAARLRKPSALR